MIHGRNLLIYVGGTAVAGAKSCEVDAELDVVEVSSPPSGIWREYIAGRRAWTVSASTLVTSMHDSVVQVGSKVWLTLVTRGSDGSLTTDRLSGWAFVTRVKVSGSVGSLVKGTFTFKGSGELKRETLVLRSGEPYALREAEEEVLTVVGGIY